MKTKAILTFFIVLKLSLICVAQQIKKEKVLSDLEVLKTSLEKTHYDLYAYTSKKEFDENYQNVRASISEDSLSLLEVTSLFQKVISKANTGHAEIDFPVASYRAYASDDGTLFPLEIVIEDGKALIRKNFSTNSEIRVGSEVVKINNVPVQELLSKIYPQLSAETTYFKNAKLELYTFPRLYWQVFGKQDVFKITTKDNNEITEYHLKAVHLMNDFELKRTDIISPERYLKFYQNTAYLKPGNFSGDEQQYKIFIDSVFTEIKIKNSKNLILDLRNNGGGHDAFSDYMVSYFANKPFTWNSKFTLKTSAILKEQTRIQNDTTDSYFKQILAHKDGAYYDYPFENYIPQSKSKRFEGKVYVLINRHSYSMAAVTAAMIQDYGFASIVGEETGDFPTLHASQFSYRLPETDIVVKVPKGYFVRPNGNTNTSGVIPDIKIKDHLVDENDEILNSILKKIALF